MGMFDYVNFECICPTCKKNVTDFQSKDGECNLSQLETHEVSNYYSICEFCKTWIEYTNGKMKFELNNTN